MPGGKNQTIFDTIHINKLNVFSTTPPKHVNNGKQQMTSPRNDLQLFSCCTSVARQGMETWMNSFDVRNRTIYHPALSDEGSLHLGTKGDLLTCLEDISNAQSEAPSNTSLVLDGAVIVQMLKLAATMKSKVYSLHTYQQGFKLYHA